MNTQHIKTSGEIIPVSPRDGAHFQLDELQSFVGGYIELATTFRLKSGRKMLMFCNEEGKLKGLPINTDATILYAAFTGIADDPIVGDVLVCREDEVE